MKKLIYIQAIVLLAGMGIMAVKALAYLITNSNVILTDAMESVINILAGTFALYSLILASKPRDRNHPYGHGKIEFISATIEGTLILLAGLTIIGKAIYNLVYPQEVTDVDIGIYLTGGAGLVNFILGGILVYHGKKNKSITMEADGRHLLSDGYSTVGMIVGLVIIYYTGLIWIDNSVAALFGLVIAFTGIKIMRRSVPGIMDEADMELLREIVDTLEEKREDNWIDIHNLRVIKYGSIYHLDCHMTLPWYFSVEQAHDEMKKVEGLIKNKYGSTAELFVHSDPCLESSCGLCTIENCEVRKNPFKKKLVWNLENVLENKQHEAI